MSSDSKVDKIDLGPWSNHAVLLEQGSVPGLDDVDPMVRGVWNMADTIKSNQVSYIADAWLHDFVIKSLETEERAETGDEWVTIGSSWREYFYADGFAGLKYGASNAEDFLQSRGRYTHVDWFATPTAINSLASTLQGGLDIGISIGLSSHADQDQMDQLATEQNIHHINGSALDPAVHAKMLEQLGGRTIDLFTARPKGGFELLPVKIDAASLNYYYRILSFIYQHMSPNGFMFIETPHDEDDGFLWNEAANKWIEMLQNSGIDADNSGTAFVIRRDAEHDTLPHLGQSPMDDFPYLYRGDERLVTFGLGLKDVELSRDHYLEDLKRHANI